MNGTEHDEEGPNRERALNLLRYLQEFVKLRARVVRRVEDYQREGLVTWIAEVPTVDGCACPLWCEMGEGREDTWLEVKKQRLDPYPNLPEVLRPWVDNDSLRSSSEEPEIRQVAYLPSRDSGTDESRVSDQAADNGGEPFLKAHKLEDHPEIINHWKAYLGVWRPWAKEHRTRSQVQKLYSELFRAYQSQRRLGETFEFLIGLGLLIWTTPQQQVVRRHVVTAQAELKFDEKRGVISVECPPPPEGARLQLEDEFLEPTDHPSREYYESAEAQLAEIGDAIWDRERIDRMLEAWATALHPDAQYSATDRHTQAAASTPLLVFAPALILRKRTVRGTLAAYSKIIQQIEAGTEVPFGFCRLVDHLEDRGFAGSQFKGPPSAQLSSAGMGLPDQILFPLPANSEQTRIVEELGHRQGVLVQGPPGTGKSQTIANLICHFLALGKRVLVTSETPRALRVLKSKIPSEVQPLCVSLLGADTASFSELESSINGIGRRYSQWRDSVYDERIEDLEADLRSSRSLEAEVALELRQIRESETYPVTLAGGQYRGTAAAIARRVNEERESYGWIALADDAPEQPPLESRQVLRLRKTLLEIPPERQTELALILADSDSLPHTGEVSDLIRAETDAASHAESYSKLREDPAYDPLLRSTRERREKLKQILEEFVERLRAATMRTEEWIPRAIVEVLAEQESAWGVLADRTRENIKGLREAAQRCEVHRLQMPEGREPEEVLADARQVHDHLSGGGRWSLLGIPLGPSRGKSYLRKHVRVDGRLADNFAVLATLIDGLDTRQRLQRLWQLWEGLASARSRGLETQVAELSEHLEALDLVFDLLELARSAAELLTERPRVPTPEWHSEQPRQLLDVIQAVEAKTIERDARAKTEGALEILDAASSEGNAHPVNRMLREALKQRNLGAWTESLDALCALERDRDGGLRPFDSCVDRSAIPSRRRARA